jgi:hypothetical protein
MYEGLPSWLDKILRIFLFQDLPRRRLAHYRSRKHRAIEDTPSSIRAHRPAHPGSAISAFRPVTSESILPYADYCKTSSLRPSTGTQALRHSTGIASYGVADGTIPPVGTTVPSAKTTRASGF